MFLLNLPVEVLLLIGSFIIADRETETGFQNLYLSCKTAKNTYQPLLLRYNLCRKYRDFGYRRGVKSAKGWPIRTPWQLLYEIHLQPQIVDVIEFADLRLCEWGGDNDDTEYDWHDNPDSGYEKFDMKNAISSILEQSPHLSKAGCDWPQWLDRMLDQERQWRHVDDRNATSIDALWGNVFLLSLLSNVETIVVNGHFVHVESRGWPEEAPLNNLLKYLAENARYNAAPLSKLHEVLPGADSGYDRRYGLDNYQYFLALPTLEVATLGCCIAMDDGYTGIPLKLHVDGFVTVKELDLWDSIVGASEIYELLSRMPSLEIFKLRESVKYHGCGYTTFEPREIVSNVARAVGHHLRAFSLTTACDLGGCDRMITSFHEFEKLEDLEFTCDLVEETGFCLVDTIPRTVKRLRVRGGQNFWNDDATKFIRKLFEGFEVDFPADLPNLEILEVIFSDPSPLQDTEEGWKNFQALLEPYARVQALKKCGFLFMQYKKPWPEWFKPDRD